MKEIECLRVDWDTDRMNWNVEDEYADLVGTLWERIHMKVQIHDEPIKDNYDLWLALDEAEKTMREIIAETNKYKYIRESQQKANKEVFANLKKLVMDYVQK